MKKKLILGTMWWILLCGSMWNVFAYSIWSPVQYVKQLFVTPNGSSDQSKATIKIDGLNGSITAVRDVVWGIPKDQNWKPLLNVVNLDNSSSRVTTRFEWNNSIDSHFLFQNQNPTGIASIQVRWKENSYNWDAPYLEIGVSNKNKKAYINWNVASISLSNKVWIWTTDPQAKLDVNWWIRAKKWMPTKIDHSNVWYAFGKDWDTWLFASGGNEYEHSDLVLDTDGVPRLIVKHDWNVWIWTTDPKAKLDVNGDIAINGIKTIQMKTKTIRLKWSIKKYYPVVIHFANISNNGFYNKIVITAKPRGQLTNTPNAEWNKCNDWNCYDYRHPTNIYINYEWLTDSRWATSHFIKKDWFDDASDVKECKLTMAGRALMCYMAWNRHYSIHGTFSSIDIYYTPWTHWKWCTDVHRWACGGTDQRLDYHTVYSR